MALRADNITDAFCFRSYSDIRICSYLLYE
nr:MAG TPA: hypothetical protein [Caudoviricetes sp.]